MAYYLGTNANDTLTGSAADDSFDLYDGDDSVYGGDGLNFYSGGAGNDTLRGGWNIDVFDGGPGDDLMVGGGGGSDHATYPYAVSGVVANLATGLVTGGAGNDTLESIEYLSGSDFDDTLAGDAGANILSGNYGDDVLAGGDGNDGLHGGRGNDYLDGGSGDDWLTTGAGDDVLLGGEGDDLFEAASDGHHQLCGGTGSDTVSFWTSGAVIVDLQFQDVQSRATESFAIAGFEHAIGGGGDDLLMGSTIGNRLGGSWGSDTLVGKGGNDTLQGGEGGGDVALFTGSFRDYLFTRSGEWVSVQDQVSSRDGNDEVGDTTEFLRFSDAQFSHAAVPRFKFGTADGNILLGDERRDWLEGGDGNDVLYGESASDTLFGGAGSDKLDGGDGLDTAWFALSIGAYNYTWNSASTLAVIDTSGSGDGSDSLDSMERIRFSDYALAFDLDGDAGIALRWIAATLGADNLMPQWVGYGIAAVEAGWSDAQISQAATAVRFGGVDDASFAGELWENVFGYPASQQEVGGLVSLLSSGAFTRASMLEYVIDNSLVDPRIDFTYLAGVGALYEPAFF